MEERREGEEREEKEDGGRAREQRARHRQNKNAMAAPESGRKRRRRRRRGGERMNGDGDRGRPTSLTRFGPSYVAFHGASLDARFSSRAHHETRYEMVSLFRPLPLLLIPLDRHTAPVPQPLACPYTSSPPSCTFSYLFLTVPSVLSSILSPSAFFLPSRDRG